MQEVVTCDFSKFGYRELAEAGELLKAYGENGAPFLGDGITINFNTQSGIVFLSDEDYNVAILEDGKLVQFHSCMVCGYEGTQAQAQEDGRDFEEHMGFCSQLCEDENEGK